MKRECEVCDGTGQINNEHVSYQGIHGPDAYENCKYCYGKGYFEEKWEKV